ncbi:Glyco_trans_4-like_N domain-containing protein [Candidatus Methylocalor cossyra]|uniref:Glyco_trans_4-like_N domain-containing protein n=2 Tax=Candidatus Methylocalor cossyra TaxID=3108543 RepID=A0ABM9NKB5_9GAMM
MYTGYFLPEYSGAAQQALALARELRDRGHVVEFVTVRWPGLPAEDLVEGFPVHRLTHGRRQKHREFALWFNLLRYAWSRRKDFDILHSHGAYYTNAIVGPLGRLLGLKSLVKASLAGDDLSGLKRSATGWVHFWFLRSVDACVAISRDLEREFLEGGLAPERIHFLPNGVDLELFAPVPAARKLELRRALGLPEERIIAVYVGVIDRRKNILWLAEQWVERQGFGTGALLLVVGPQSRDDPEGRLVGRLRDLGQTFPDLLQFRGFNHDIRHYYGAADLLVLPSRKEGLPNVVLEAMASGLPCVTAQASGSRELVCDGTNGYTYVADDADSLARALTLCLGEREALGRRGRELTVQQYSLARIADQYVALYARLLGA